MIPVLMLMFSCMALAQFFMSYCRSVLLSYAKVEISATTREIIGLETSQISGEQFRRLLGLLRLAPSPGDDKWDVRVISIYYAAVWVAALLLAPVAPIVRNWSEQQSNLCAYFVAVALDRRVTIVSAS